MAPLICTQNTLSHIDYGTPLVAHKSTDYRTSTGKNHRFIPSVPQYFDCRVKSRIKPELLDKNIAIREEFKSRYTKDYIEKSTEENSLQRSDRARGLGKVDCIQNAQEKIYMEPPPVKEPKISEMKEAYKFHNQRPTRDVFLNNICEIPDIFRAVQPDILPEAKGYCKLLDIYLTENREKYVPYTKEQLQKAQEDLVTIYNASGRHKGLKEELPGRLHGFKNVYDKSIFKLELPNRFLSNVPKRCPNFGMKTEYQGNYPTPACSNFSPYLQENGIYFPESLSGPGPWQNLCPPAMYCSENCHIGTGWPVRSAVDINSAQKRYIHKTCCLQV